MAWHVVEVSDSQTSVVTVPRIPASWSTPPKHDPTKPDQFGEFMEKFGQESPVRAKDHRDLIYKRPSAKKGKKKKAEDPVDSETPTKKLKAKSNEGASPRPIPRRGT